MLQSKESCNEYCKKLKNNINNNLYFIMYTLRIFVIKIIVLEDAFKNHEKEVHHAS